MIESSSSEISVSPRRLLVTGGAGFIGANYVRQRLRNKDVDVLVNLDKLTYAGNLDNLIGVRHPGYHFVEGDINDRELVERLLSEHEIDAIVHFAAESHVDRSIEAPEAFAETNILGTLRLLQAARSRHANCPNFRFVHVSTDEVYGALGPDDPPFSESTSYDPHSPYAASKAASDHLVRAWGDTYGLPVLITNCSNNYGPYQFPEKLIPLMILNALEGKPLPVYGDGKNVRDWLFVADHCEAIHCVLTRGATGRTYNIGGETELTNLDVVHAICDELDRTRPLEDGGSRRELITFVKDRPGHDWRYAMDISRIRSELGWKPKIEFKQGLHITASWYAANLEWCNKLHERKRLGVV